MFLSRGDRDLGVDDGGNPKDQLQAQVTQLSGAI